MKTDIELQKAIMRRVYATYFLRQAGRPVARLAALALAALAAAPFISVPQVIANMAGVSDIARAAGFFASAFFNTELLVQTAVILATAVALWSITDLVRELTRARVYA